MEDYIIDSNATQFGVSGYTYSIRKLADAMLVKDIYQFRDECVVGNTYLAEVPEQGPITAKINAVMTKIVKVKLLHKFPFLAQTDCGIIPWSDIYKATVKLKGVKK